MIDRVERDAHRAKVVSPARRPPWKVVERLGEQIIRDMLSESRSGMTQRVLAERYGISLSSVKRLVRVRFEGAE